ncbi:MAG TPA: TetR family transcriptional regulator, partial [Paraburkholderia sp.]|nr:TetR family transcriptional regulator [Paraburkholderia sp.]
MTSKALSGSAVRYHHGNLRNALIAEGRRALEEVGSRELSLRYLARAVGVSEAAPSRHFPGKEGLLAAIAADGFRDLAALRKETQESEESTLARCYRMMKVYVDFAQAHKGLFDLMVGPRIVERDAYDELTEEGENSFR